MKDNITKIFVGVDVAKDFLDIHFHPLKKSMRIANSIDGLTKLLRMLAQYEVSQIVCEASGGYESLMLGILKKEQYKVWRVQPYRIRAFITSEGIKAKTDRIDARMIALFASQKDRGYQTVECSQDEECMRALTQLRTDCVKAITRENNKVQHPQQHIVCKKIIEKNISFFQKQLREIEKQIENIMRTNNDMATKASIIQSIPGVGKVTAHTLMTEVTELGKIDNKKIAALVGVAPFVRQSGKGKGSALISGGRKNVRSVLYMAALVASRCNPILRSFYQRLKEAGKPAKLALVAVMRKLIVIINTIVKKGELWSPKLNY